ncbi:unnamed protein product [Boreogadus saida]
MRRVAYCGLATRGVGKMRELGALQVARKTPKDSAHQGERGRPLQFRTNPTPEGSAGDVNAASGGGGDVGAGCSRSFWNNLKPDPCFVDAACDELIQSQTFGQAPWRSSFYSHYMNAGSRNGPCLLLQHFLPLLISQPLQRRSAARHKSADHQQTLVSTSCWYVWSDSTPEFFVAQRSRSTKAGSHAHNMGGAFNSELGRFYVFYPARCPWRSSSGPQTVKKHVFELNLISKHATALAAAAATTPGFSLSSSAVSSLSLSR